MTLIGIQMIPVSNSKAVPQWAWPVIFLMGIAFVSVGGSLVFGRRWTTLDSGKGIIVKKWGLLVPLRTERFPLSDYDGVRLQLEAGDSESADRYPVILQGQVGRSDMELFSRIDYASAREQSEYIADFLHLPFVDASTDHEVVVTPGRATLGSSGRTRVSRDPGEDVARPPFMRSQVDQSGGKVRIVVAGPGFRPSMLLGFILPIAVLGYAIPYILEFFRRTQTPAYVQTFFVGFLLLFFFILPSIGTINGIIRSIRGRTLVEASADGITIEEQGAWRKRVTFIPAAGIFGVDFGTAETPFDSITRVAEEQYYRNRPVPGGTALARMGLGRPRKQVKSRGILVKCRDGIVAIGGGLPGDEVRYLYALIRQALAASHLCDKLPV